MWWIVARKNSINPIQIWMFFTLAELVQRFVCIIRYTFFKSSKLSRELAVILFPLTKPKKTLRLWLVLQDVKNFPFVKFVPGKKCCAGCYNRLKSQKESDDLNDSDIREPENMDLEGFNNSVLFFSISPMKISDQQGAAEKARYAMVNRNLNQWKRSYPLRLVTFFQVIYQILV